MNLFSLHRAHIQQLSVAVAAALERNGFATLAVHSGSPIKRTNADDQFWPLRATPHFQHWLPLAEPGCLLIVTPGRKPVLVRPPVESFWEAPAPSESDHFWGSFEVVERPPTLPAGRVAFIGDDAEAAAALGIADVNPPDLVRSLDALRVRKTPYEVECLAEANRRAALGHDELRRRSGTPIARARAPPRVPRRHAPGRPGDAVQEHRRARPQRRDAPSRQLRTRRHARRVAPARRRRLLPRLLLGHHAHVGDRRGASAASHVRRAGRGMEAMQKRLVAKVPTGCPTSSCTTNRTARSRDPAGRGHLQASRRRARRARRQPRLLPARARPLARAAVPRRGMRPAAPARRQPVPAQHDEDRGRAGLHDRAGPLLHRGAAGAVAQPADIDWKLVDALAQLGGIRIEDDVVVQEAGIRNLTREVLPQGGGAA